jgi:hypothetical protein
MAKKKNGKPKPIGDGKSEAEVKLEKQEQVLNNFIKSLANGEKILNETKAIQEGLRNINPLQIGHRMIVIRELFGVKKLDKKSANAKMFESYKTTKVYKLGFAKATINRYVNSWQAAVSLYPERFVTEMASRLFGERVTPEQPFGKYTSFVAGVAKRSKEDIKDGSKVAGLVETIIRDFKPKTAKRPEKKAADFLLAAYDAVMENLRRYLVANDTEIGGLEAKDVFLTNLTPYLLRGFGCALDYTEQVEVRELPNGYEPFMPLDNRDKEATAPLGQPEAKPQRVRKPKAATPPTEAVPPAQAEKPTLAHHEEKHPDKPAEEKSPFAAA